MGVVAEGRQRRDALGQRSFGLVSRAGQSCLRETVRVGIQAMAVRAEEEDSWG